MAKKSQNQKIKLFLSNIKEQDSKKLGSQKRELERELKKLSKKPFENQRDIKLAKQDLKGVQNKLDGKISINTGVGTLNVKKDYFEKLKDPDKYIENYKRGRIERMIAKQSDIASQSQKKSDFNKLQGLKNRYEAQHEGQKGFKSGIVKAVDSQLKQEQDRPFSTFRKKKKPQIETERLMTVDEDTWEIKDIEFSS